MGRRHAAALMKMWATPPAGLFLVHDGRRIERPDGTADRSFQVGTATKEIRSRFIIRSTTAPYFVTY